MSDYYFDIEINPGGQKPGYKNDEILTIQFQGLDSRTGERKGELNILKSWESSEREIYIFWRSSFPYLVLKTYGNSYLLDVI
tara:strand:+ start:107 stop:352 length:246 start_codon:yes stop_codon:yes gene_type:complete